MTFRGLLAIFAFLSLWALSLPLAAKTVYVSITGSDTADGLSWATAKKTIRAANEAARSYGDEVWVAKGTYVSGDVRLVYAAFYGGFSGDETSREQRNWRVNQTIVDASKGYPSAFTIFGSSTYCRVDGFCIRNARNHGVYCSSSGSGVICNNIISGSVECGIYAEENCSPIIQNNLIIGNGGTTGGGIYLGRHSKATVTNNTIIGNVSTQGGAGIYLGEHNWSSYYFPTIANNIIAFNTSGIWKDQDQATNPTFNNNCVYGNMEYNYKGMADQTGACGNISVDPRLGSVDYWNYHIQPDSPCINKGDDAATASIAFDLDGQPRISDSHIDIGADESAGETWVVTPSIVRVTSEGDDLNSGSGWSSPKKTIQSAINAVSAAGGGEVWVKAGTYSEIVTLPTGVSLFGGFCGSETDRTQRDWVSNPTTLVGLDPKTTVLTATVGHGGTIDGFHIKQLPASVGSSAANTVVLTSRYMTVSHNIVEGGSAGIAAGSASSIITNNIITGSVYGISVGGVRPTVVNNTVVGNGVGISLSVNSSSPESGPIANNVICFNGAGMKPGWPNMANNNIYGNSQDYDGQNLTGQNGNISADPMFVDLFHRDFHLSADSPCRNAGNNGVAQSFGSDIDCRERSSDGQIDIGADEWDGTDYGSTPLATIHVTSAGNDSNDGLSWQSAKKTIQAGIDASSSAGGEVWVASGTYKENIRLKPFALVYGGFAGSETARSQRNWRANPTIIDGGGTSTVVFAHRIGAYISAIDGFVIQNGGNTQLGGGIQLLSAATEVAHNIIRNNYSIGDGKSSDGSGTGGGINCSNSSSTIRDNLIVGNIADSIGGGIYADWNSSLELINNTIVGNSARNGGAIALIECSPSLHAINNIISCNSSGIMLTGDAPDFRRNCVFSNGSYNFNGLMEPADNIYDDPGFVNATHGDFRIASTSPCRDAGDSTYVEAVDTDIFCHPRIPDGKVDIGSYESTGDNYEPSTVIVRVSTTGNDANDGSTWSLAKKTVGAAIASLDASYGGEIWVATGTYPEKITIPTFTYLYGGFNGSETSRSERDPKNNITVLDGQGVGCVVTINSASTSGAFDGFSIVGGGYGARYGGANDVSGIALRYSSAAVTNNTVAGGKAMGILCLNSGSTLSHNTITTNNDIGIYCINGSLTIDGNTISGNKSKGISANKSSVTISGNRICRNTGGAIYCTNASKAVISQNYIESNSGATYTGIDASSVSGVIMTNNIVTANRGSSTGGAVSPGYGAVLVGNSIVWNTGTGLYLASSPTTMANNVIAYNSSGVLASTFITGMTSKHNCVFNPDGYNYSGNITSDGDINADPKLAWFGDMRLRLDSPCIDAGDDSTLSICPVDFAGISRTQGTHVDIGAYESDGNNISWTTTVIRVSPNGSDANDGSTWLLAKKTVQSAVTALGEKGGEVWVASGTYYENLNVGPYVFLYGGFDGTETTRETRSIKKNPCVLDGKLKGSVITIDAGNRTGKVDGFTIRNGKSNNGGGINCIGMGTPSVCNNTISNNSATGYGGGIYGGGDVYQNTISQNISEDYGGGLAQSLSVHDNTIVSNNAAGGGAVYSAKSVRSNLIQGNSAEYVGGGIYTEAVQSTISGNRIIGNSCEGWGGGLYLSYDKGSVVANNIVSGNSAVQGSGMLITDSRQGPQIINNTLATNAGLGSAIEINSASATLVNNIVAVNTSGIYKSGSSYNYTLQTANNCSYGNTKGNYLGFTPSATDISNDPLFIDRTAGDFHIATGSPCINAGSTNATGIPAFDFDSEPRIRGGAVDIGADECWLGAPTPGEAKLSPDNTSVELSGAVVTAVIGDAFYIETENRTSGIRVDKTGHGLVIGDKAYVIGNVVTDEQGERCVVGDAIRTAGNGLISPLAVTNASLGGSTLGLQDAVWSWRNVKIPGDGYQLQWLPSVGLNNIGLLVRTSGIVTQIDPDGKYFYIDDGSRLKDDTITGVQFNKGVRIAGDGNSYTSGQFVTLTGISSCFKGDDGKLRRLVKPTSIQSN